MFDYFLSKHEFFEVEKAKVAAEQRKERLEAYLEYLTTAQTAHMDEKTAKVIAARYRLLVFANSDIIEKMAAANRFLVQLKANKEGKYWDCDETPDSRRVIENEIAIFQSLRK